MEASCLNVLYIIFIAKCHFPYKLCFVLVAAATQMCLKNRKGKDKWLQFIYRPITSHHLFVTNNYIKKRVLILQLRRKNKYMSLLKVMVFWGKNGGLLDNIPGAIIPGNKGFLQKSCGQMFRPYFLLKATICLSDASKITCCMILYSSCL